LNFSDDLIDQLGWSEDQEIEWIISDDNTVILKKKDD
jgi:hypothetical protein